MEHEKSNKCKAKAISLLSGGLDSRLAVLVLLAQNLEVHGIIFKSPFFNEENAKEAGRSLGIKTHIFDFTADIVDIINRPRYGFGSCLNPCIDCHIRMLKRAGELVEDLGFDFISTGEVLDQRPMSQNMGSLELVAKESGYKDIILRPLSAKLLPATKPEQMGLVDRTKLLDIRGRGRKRQMLLAREFGISNYPTPSGGCRLTEPNFCNRLKDLKEHEGLNGIHSLNLLRIGRHFRLADNIKFVLGRNEEENVYIEGTAELYEIILKCADAPGPSGLLPINASKHHIDLAASICARYSDVDRNKPSKVIARSSAKRWVIEAVPLPEVEIVKYRIG